MRAILRIAASMAVSAVCLGAALTDPVLTDSGLVKGVAVSAAITAFKGIPFAAPPVGDLRWRAPAAPLPWQGVRAADKFGASCIQKIVQEHKPWTHEFMAHGDISEDCLFLNIWTPAASAREKHPVLVFLHGGANTEGSGSIDLYNGEGLARKGVVMITINYRLGIFGFFAHPGLTKESAYHASGNYALLDQIATLKWVRRNIAAFGGDADRVTVAGQSAGASDIAMLLASPLAKGLFQRAIMESGGAPGMAAGPALAAAEAEGVRFAQQKSAASLAALRAMSWQDLMAPPASGTAQRFGSVSDGYVAPASPKEIFAAGRQNDVPTLAGSNADENGAVPNPKVTVAQWAARGETYGQLYPAANDEEAGARSNEAARDRQRVALDEWAALRAKTSHAPAFLYFYNHVLPGADAAQYGAFHTSEVPYALNTLAKSDRPFTPEDRGIADTISSYWANFAANGDPNGKGLPHWPATTEEPDGVMELGDHTGPIPAADSAAKIGFFKTAAK